MKTDHEQLIKELAHQFQPVLDNSPDGVYLWLDEQHKVCNNRLAQLFGYTIEEWCAAESFLNEFVAEEDQENFSWLYHNKVGRLAHPVTFRFRGVRKNGSTFAAETEMIPISYSGHAVAYHFVRQVGE